MSDSNLIDQLIDTYHALNTRVRTVDESRLSAGTAEGGSIEEIVRRMRDDELKYSQALKERVTGVAMPDIFGGGETPVIGTEASEDSTAIMISQFGSAREVTLSLLRDLPAEEWDTPQAGGKTIRERVNELVDSDQRQLARIASQLEETA